MVTHRDKLNPLGDEVRIGMKVLHQDRLPALRGHVWIKMVDTRTNEVLLERDFPNLVTLDSGLLIARLTKDPTEPNYGIYMLAVGTGANGNPLAPDAPSREQRVLNAEIERKAFSSVVFRDALGGISAIPTNVVDYTTIFSESEAVGTLNEMGLISPISANPTIKNDNPNQAGQGGQVYDPTIDVTLYDILVNHLTFSVISKPSTATLTITWRITS